MDKNLLWSRRNGLKATALAICDKVDSEGRHVLNPAENAQFDKLKAEIDDIDRSLEIADDRAETTVAAAVAPASQREEVQPKAGRYGAAAPWDEVAAKVNARLGLVRAEASPSQRAAAPTPSDPATMQPPAPSRAYGKAASWDEIAAKVNAELGLVRVK